MVSLGVNSVRTVLSGLNRDIWCEYLSEVVSLGKSFIGQFTCILYM